MEGHTAEKIFPVIKCFIVCRCSPAHIVLYLEHFSRKTQSENIIDTFIHIKFIVDTSVLTDHPFGSSNKITSAFKPEGPGNSMTLHRIGHVVFHFYLSDTV